MSKLVLNDEQKRAVEHSGGPLLIIAGAGTGKTTVLTERIKHLITANDISPAEILAVTFTEKAAREMEERVDKALPYGYTQTYISTFHSFCDRILRNEVVQIGLSPAYRLIGESEATQLLKRHIWEFDLSYFRPRGNPTKFISGLLTHFNRLKDEDVSPAEYKEWVEHRKHKNTKTRKHENGNAAKQQDTKRTEKQSTAIEIEKWEELAYLYREYQELKVKENVLDFADLISTTLELFRRRENVLWEYREKFRYILVDEFQDTNIAQYELIKLLAPDGKKPQLTMVGDDSQSIYRFRGAAVSNIVMFMEDYPKAEQVVLTKNYRSTQTILNHAYQLIQYNNPDTLENRLGIDKNLKAVKKDTPKQGIELIRTERVEDEAEQVAAKIRRLHEKQGYSWQDCAILVRANSHSEPFVRALKRNGIPFQFLGPGRLFRQEEVLELISYIKTLADFTDSAAFYRVLAMSIWGISGRDLAAVAQTAKRSGRPLFETCEAIAKKGAEVSSAEQNLPRISPQTKEKITELIQIVHRHQELIPRETAGQILYYFLEDSGLLPKLVEEAESARAESKIANISRFFDKLKNYESEHEEANIYAVSDWLELALELGESPLAADLDWTQENKVNILTVHSAKGLEFPAVFLVNLVNLRFPSVNRREQIPIPEELIHEYLPEGDFHAQEERRLFYVGMTRAMERLYFSAAKYYGEGKRERRLSGFVREALGEAKLSEYLNREQISQIGLFDSYKGQQKEEKVENRKKHRVSFLSYSQISTFQLCPLHYKLRYILKVPTPTSAAQTFGTNIHAALKDYYTYLMRTETWDKERMLKYLEENWSNVGFGSERETEENYRKAREYLVEFHKQENKEKVLTRGVEEKFSFPLTNGLRVGGIIDRIDHLPGEGVEIIDYKTSERVPTQKDADKDLQLTLYGLAATEVRHPLLLKQPEEVKLSLYYFAEQKKLTTTRTAEELTEAKKEIIEIAEEIESSDFACSGHPWCSRCEYKLYCAAE